MSSARISRIRSERQRPLTIRTQSLRKNTSSTIAVAKCVAIRNVRKNLSFWWMFQPASAGSTTPWPRLEIGNGSAIPWVRPEDHGLEVADQRCGGDGEEARHGRGA